MKVAYLFDMTKFPQREAASRAEFIEDSRNLLPEFLLAYEYAFRRMREERSKLKPIEVNASWPSQTIHRHISAWLISNLKMGPDLKMKKTCNTFYIETKKYVLVFKKLDEHRRPYQNNTKRSRLLKSNRTRTHEDSKTIVFIGYQVDCTWSMLLSVYAVNLTDETKNWEIDLEDFSCSSIPLSVVSTSIEESVPEPEVRLRVKENRKKA